MTRQQQIQEADIFLENILSADNINNIILSAKMGNYSVTEYINDRLNFTPRFDHLNKLCPNDSIFLVTGINPNYTKKVSAVISVLEQMGGLEFPFFAIKENKFIVHGRGIRRSDTLLLPNNKQVGMSMFNTKEYKINELLEEQPIKIS